MGVNKLTHVKEIPCIYTFQIRKLKRKPLTYMSINGFRNIILKLNDCF